MSTRALAPRDTFEQYMSEVNRIPLLSRTQEDELTSEFAESQDPAIAHRLVVSNLRFVVRIANEYRGYGLKLIDLVQEGNLGLMIAVQKFDHRRGYRLISYAVWWIRAYIQAYVMRSVSMVKLGTTQAQRKLFFGRRKAQATLLKQGAEPTRENMFSRVGSAPCLRRVACALRRPKKSLRCACVVPSLTIDTERITYAWMYARIHQTA